MNGEDEVGGGEESGGRVQQFPPLGATATAREGSRDSGKYHLDYTVLEMGVTKLGSVGIEGDFWFFLRDFEFFRREVSEFNRWKSRELRGRNRGFVPGSVAGSVGEKNRERAGGIRRRF
ncbi:hypothetical protein CRG98_015729 [Punica granatum]|uniref:Uncharacterized protein n=1 Tax=Punica granatum TaxID=22663 RepID=A0A2I0K700_PUNGR|nr:hypothetical protein CRG98_015729 [Punica granatum]